MSRLLELPPYEKRDDQLFLEEMNALSYHHINGCAYYSNIWQGWQGSDDIKTLPFLHVGLFKQLDLKTLLDGFDHTRSVRSSSTGGVASYVQLDQKSSAFQSASCTAILKNHIGDDLAALLVLDSSKSLRERKGVSARIAAAMSLQPLSTSISFLLKDKDDPATVDFNILKGILKDNNRIIIYGFSRILWQGWAKQKFPDDIKQLLSNVEIVFVHSGGWKKLEHARVDRDTFNRRLLAGVGSGSKVVDYYGLVEQVGIIYPLCFEGFRHVPVWADILVRDSWSMKSLTGKVGQLQLINSLAWGAPYHNVLTEDLAIIHPGPCKCGRSGKKFELIGRIPKAEVRGCSNV